MKAIPDELAGWIAERRWFRSKTRPRRNIEILDRVQVGRIDVLFVRVVFEDGGDEVYVVPLAKAPRGSIKADHAIVHAEGDDVVYDALATGELADALVAAMREGRSFGDARSMLRVKRYGVSLDDLPPARASTAEQTNTAVMFGDRLIMKVYRRAIEGRNPEVEILRFLEGRAVSTPRLAGEVEWVREGHAPAAVAVLSTFVKSKGDAWAVTLDALRALLAEKTTLDAEIARAELLGRRTAQLHRALASSNDDAFAPASVRDTGALVVSAREGLDGVLDKLRTRPELVAADARASVDRLLREAPRLRTRLDEICAIPLASKRIRVHGDYHLGQVLVTPDDDFVIIDFEGEPARSLEERCEKALPMRDVAGMLRSFDYAAVTALREAGKGRALIDDWRSAVSSAFVRAWRQGVAGSAAEPASDDEARALLDLFLLEKAVYEVAYELDNRPAWLAIPVEGLLSLIETREK